MICSRIILLCSVLWSRNAISSCLLDSHTTRTVTIDTLGHCERVGCRSDWVCHTGWLLANHTYGIWQSLHTMTPVRIGSKCGMISSMHQWHLGCMYVSWDLDMDSSVKRPNNLWVKCEVCWAVDVEYKTILLPSLNFMFLLWKQCQYV